MLEVFEKALRKLDKTGNKKFGTHWYSRMGRRRETFKKAYAALDEPDRDPIAYAALTAQASYVFAYAPARAEYARQFLLRHRARLGRPMFDHEVLNAVSFGGGPASELVGLIRYLEDPKAGEIVQHVSYSVYDKDGDWEEVAQDVADCIKSKIKIDVSYEEVDAASSKAMSSIDLSSTELVIFSYVMSELCRVSHRDKIAENFRATLAELPLQSKILFIDNLHPIFIEYFRDCKLVKGLEQKSDSGDPVDCNLPELTGTFKKLSEELDWTPRTDLRSVSKLIVRTRK